MEKYINQLLGDIQDAHRQLTAEELKEADTFEQHIREVEGYLSGIDEQPFSYHCGLQKEQFPPANRLTYEQLNRLCEAFIDLLASWHIYATLPDEVPVDMAYEVLVSTLDQELTLVTTGDIGLDFCDFIPEECVFKEHCPCVALFAELEEEERQNELLAQRLIKSLKTALAKMPKDASFSRMHHLSEEEPKPEERLQPIANWVGISLEDFQEKYHFNPDQLEDICDALLAFWEEEDEIHIWIRGVNSYTRYRSLVEFLGTEVWFLENKLFVAPPIDPEVLRTIKSPLDSLHFKDLLDFSEDDLEDDLPF